MANPINNQQSPANTESALFPSYARYPLAFAKGKGSYLWDVNGKKYLDFMCGLAVTNLGHAPERVTAKLKDQLDQLWHTSNLFQIPNQEKAAQMLTSMTSGDAVFFCNSGAEANEAAIKLARKYQQKIKGEERYEIITFTQSFHGRTLATLTATGQDKVKEGFHPLPAGFITVPLNDLDALQDAIGPYTAAVMLEMIQAEGGVHPAGVEYVQAVAELCKQNGLLLIIDEIQTGMGRTGKLLAFEHYGIEPDIFTLAKGLASGFPVGAMVGKAHLKEAFSAGSHGSTFGGTPLATAAVIATLETLQEEHVVEHAAQMGDYLNQQLHDKFADHPFVLEIRGKGLMIGIECAGPINELILVGQEKGLLFVNAGPNVIRLLPNLLITKEEIDQAITLLSEIIQEYAPVVTAGSPNGK
ncbi:acetylornithine transaminase [Paenibacillus sp. WLX2291]|uniref:acetylornithine transaminase n=1 Tax=Paenibacillus sp. WLX2291 TaxID=3296934 RepID=UPI0039844B23